MHAPPEAATTAVPEDRQPGQDLAGPAVSAYALSFLEARLGRLSSLAEFWAGVLGDHPLSPGVDQIDLLALLEQPLGLVRHHFAARHDAAIELILCDGSAPGPPVRRRDLALRIKQDLDFELDAWSQGGGTGAVADALQIARARLAAGVDCVLLASAEFDRGAVVGLLRLQTALEHRCPVFAVLDGFRDAAQARVVIGSPGRPDPLRTQHVSAQLPKGAWHWRPEDAFFVTQTFTSLSALVVGALVIRECVIPPCGVAKDPPRAQHPVPFLADQRGRVRSVDVALSDSSPPGVLRLRSPVESNAVVPRSSTPWPSEPFQFAACSRSELLAQLAQARDRLLAWDGPLSLTRFAHAVRSRDGAFRVAFLARDRDDCLDRLRQALEKVASPRTREHLARFGFHCSLPTTGHAAVEPHGRTAFMAPGIGSAYQGLLQGQATRFPAVRERLDQFAMQAHPQAAALGEKLYGVGDEHQAIWSDLDWTGAVGTIAVMALEPVARQLGLVPDIRVGFSNGELAALLVAEGLKASKGRALEGLVWDAVSSGQRRAREGRLITGRMVAVHLVGAGRQLLQALLTANHEHVFLAIDAAASHVVLFGLSPRIDDVVAQLSEAGNICLPLPMDRPFHTHLIATELAAVETLLSGLEFGRCQRPVWSCARNQPYPDGAQEMASTIRDSITHTVRFREALETLSAQGVSTFIEVGGNAQLSGYARDTLKGRKTRIVALDRHGTDGALQVLDSANYLFSHGFPVDTDALAPARAERMDAGRGADAGVAQQAPAPAPGQRGPQPAQARSDPSAARSANALSDADKRALVAESLAITRDFVASQERVLNAVMAQVQASSDLVSTPSTPATGVFSGVRYDRRGNGATFSLRLEPARDEHLDHHRLGRVPAADAWRPEQPLPVLAMVMGLEFMAQAASQYLSSRARPLLLRGADDIIGSRWVMARSAAKTVDLIVSEAGDGADQRPQDDGTRLGVRLLDTVGGAPGDGTPGQQHEAASSRLSFGEPQPLHPFELEGEPLSTPWTASDFNRFALFHGAAYRCLDRLLDIRDDGVELAGSVPDQSRLVHGLHRASWLTPATLLDCVPQAVAFWLTARGLSWFTAFPVAITRYRQAPPLPVVAAAIVCRARIRIQGAQVVADACMMDEAGRVFARIEQMRIVVYQMYQPLLGRLYWREGRALLTEPDFDGVAQNEVRRSCPHQLERDLEVGGGIFGAALARLVLTEKELRACSGAAMTDAGGRAWLLAYLVAKEAVIAWFQGHVGQALDHLDFSILLVPKDNDRLQVQWVVYPPRCNDELAAALAIEVDRSEKGWRARVAARRLRGDEATVS